MRTSNRSSRRNPLCRQWLELACLLLWCTAANAALVAAWPFDEGDGEIARDASGNGNDGDLVRAAWGDGRSGSGLVFVGTGGDGYVEVADWETLQLTGKFTVCFWWHKTSDAVQIFFKKGRGAPRLNYYAYLESTLRFTVGDRKGNVHSVAAPRPSNGWHHLAFVFDEQSLRVYVDGQLAGSEETGKVSLFTDDSPLLIGTHHPGYKYCLAGTLDDFCIFDDALTPSELTDEAIRAHLRKSQPSRPQVFAPDDGAVLVLARDGVAGATIVVRANATALERVPARDLRTYIRKISGARLPIVEEEHSPAGNLILVGHSRLTREMGVLPEDFAGDSFLIRVTSSRLVLAGGDAELGERQSSGGAKWGTGNAVYSFLRDHCGVRWFMPGKLGEVVPRAATLQLPAVDRRDRLRRLYALGSFSRGNNLSWSRRNGFGTSLLTHHRGGHLWSVILSPKDYFEVHPEWYALHGRERRAAGVMICTTQPEVYGVALKNLMAIYDRGYEAVELGQSDGYRRCTCGSCEAMDEYRTPVGWMIPCRPADRIHVFHDRLARAIARSHPGRKVINIAYGPTGEVPNLVKSFPSNVVVEYTHCPPALLERWTAFHDRFVAYVYWFGQYHTMFLAPKSSPFYVASELRRMRRAGAQGFYFCGGGMCWGTEAPSYYVTGQLLRDPDLDEDAVLDEFCGGLFADAAPAMKEFFVRFLQAADRHYAFNPPVFEPGVPLKSERRPARDYFLASFTEDVLSACAASLRRAASSAKDKAVCKRVRFFKDGFDYVKLTTDGLARLRDWQQQKSPEAKAVLDAAVANRNRFVREMFSRQMAHAGDLPLVFTASLAQLLYGPRGHYSEPFKRSDRAHLGAE